MLPSRRTRPLLEPVLIVKRRPLGRLGQEPGQELWRVPFRGWDEPHELRALGRCVPRRFTVIDGAGLVRASGYIASPTCLPGEPFVLRVASPMAA